MGDLDVETSKNFCDSLQKSFGVGQDALKFVAIGETSRVIFLASACQLLNSYSSYSYSYILIIIIDLLYLIIIIIILNDCLIT